MPNCEGRSRRSGVILYSDDNDHFVVYTSPPPAAELLLKEKPFGSRIFLHYIKSAFPLIRFAMLSTFSRLGEGFYSYALCKKLDRSI